MNNLQQRGMVAKWVREVAEPWARADPTPAPGSALAGDDKGGRKVSTVAAYNLMTGVDHISSVVAAMTPERPFHRWAHLTSLRTTLEVSTRVRWILEPAERKERRLRCVRVCYQNEDQLRKMVKALNGTHIEDGLRQQRQEIIDAWPKVEAGLQAEAKALGEIALKLPLQITQMLDEQMDLNTWDGEGIANLWRTGSAAAHGFYWNDAYRTNGDEFDEAGFDTSLQGAYLVLAHALDLYKLRATCYLS